MKEFLAILEYIVEQEDEATKVIEEGKKAVRRFAPLLQNILEDFLNYAIDSHIKSVKRIESQGFDREDAINIWTGVKRNFEKMGRK